MPPVIHEADGIKEPDAQLRGKQACSGGGTGLFHAGSVMS